MKQIKHFINGEFVIGSANKFFDKRSPVDNTVIAQIAEASQSDVDAAVRAAHSALNVEWGKMTVDQRVETHMTSISAADVVGGTDCDTRTIPRHRHRIARIVFCSFTVDICTDLADSCHGSHMNRRNYKNKTDQKC
jgi:hypothetical protein